MSLPLAYILNVTHQGAACDVASIHFDPTIRRTDILVLYILIMIGTCPG